MDRNSVSPAPPGGSRPTSTYRRGVSNLTKSPRRLPSTPTILLSIGLAFTVFGLLLAIASSTMELLIHLQVVGGPGTSFRQVDIRFGLFSYTIDVTAMNGSHILFDRLRNTVWMEPVQQVFAWISCIFSFLCALVVIGIQIALLCRGDTRRWYWMTIELCLLLITVLSLLVSIALSETQLIKLRGKHDSVTEYISNLLWKQNLLPDRISSGTINSPPAEGSYIIRGPHLSFWLLVACDFLFLSGLLLSVPFFIMITENEEKKKRQLILQEERSKAILLRYV